MLVINESQSTSKKQNFLDVIKVLIHVSVYFTDLRSILHYIKILLKLTYVAHSSLAFFSKLVGEYI